MGRPAFDLVASKLRRPPLRPGTVRRSPLIECLARGEPRPIVSVVAPAGYGKTTLLAQWAERHTGRFAWVSLDEGDNDPKVLLTYIAAALDAVEPIGKRVFDALASPASSVPGAVVPRLGLALASMTSPVVLVLDDVHVLEDPECRAAVSVLADHVPKGSRLVVAGRGEPPLRVARLRAEGRIVQVGPAELALSHDEASSLLHGAGVALGEGEVAALHWRTEGWAAGLYLAALCVREGGPLANAAVPVGGDDRLVAEYLESEFLARISPDQRVFLTRTSVLARMSGRLCDEVLGMTGSAAVLTDLARSNLLLVPLDQAGEWYRYHRMFQDMLVAELGRREPELVPVLRRRAAAWCLRYGVPEIGLEYARAAGDVDTVAGLVEQLTVPAYRQGRVATVQRWFDWLDTKGGIRGHPMVMVLAALLAALTARPVDAERWADAVDRWQQLGMAGPGNTSVAAWAALLRAILCRHGAEHMRADADEAVRGFAAGSFVTPAPMLMRGLASVLSGDLDGGDVHLTAAATIAEQVGYSEDLVIALCERALVAIARGQWDWAEVLADRAGAVLREAGIEESYATPLACAVRARTAQHQGDLSAVRHESVAAQRLRPALTYALPHLAVQARLELAHVNLAQADIAGAKTLMWEVGELLRRRPGLGTLADQARALQAQLSSERSPASPGASSLTAAELRLLPMLPTHLSFPEIAEHMFLSHNTIKAEVSSIYRKLGASTRSQAIDRARNSGLLEP